MKKGLLKILTVGTILSSGLSADIQLSVVNGSLSFSAVNDTLISSNDVINIMSYQYVLNNGPMVLNIKDGNYSPEITLPSYTELQSRGLADKNLGFLVRVAADSPSNTSVIFNDNLVLDMSPIGEYLLIFDATYHYWRLGVID